MVKFAFQRRLFQSRLIFFMKLIFFCIFQRRMALFRRSQNMAKCSKKVNARPDSDFLFKQTTKYEANCVFKSSSRKFSNYHLMRIALHFEGPFQSLRITLLSQNLVICVQVLINEGEVLYCLQVSTIQIVAHASELHHLPSRS